MKLHGPDAARLIRNAGQRIVGLGSQREARGQGLRLVAMAHPDIERCGKAAKERASPRSLPPAAWPYSRAGAGSIRPPR